jgi:hypothetical protein
MVFMRRKQVRGNYYYYLVKNKRDKKTGRVRQKVVSYLGTKKKLEEKLGTKQILKKSE